MLELKDFEAAYNKVQEVVLPTKLIKSEYFSNQTGNDVYLKPENMQLTGAYKIRGAYYKISTLSEEEKAKGLITASAGNHAQGVALAAARQGVKATIVMPTTTPLLKVNRTKDLGAEVILHGDVYDEACAHALDLAAEHGYTFVHPFDDPTVATGQGTIAMDIFKELPTVDYILVPIGGGGLATGVSTLAKLLNPKIRQKFAESLKAVLPVVGIVIVLSFTIAPITSSILLCFLVGAAMVMAGMMFFTLGAEMSMTPMGEKVGARMTQSKNILLIVVLSFLLGVVITISEPDLQVLATQVPSVPNMTLILAVAVGVGIFLVIALLRMIGQFGNMEVVFDTVNKRGMTMMKKKYMKQVGHADAQMFFYVDSAEELAAKIGGNVKVITEEPYYRYIPKNGLKLSTKVSMTVSDQFKMVKMIHLKL